MELKAGVKTFYAKTQKEWRKWLETKRGILEWILYAKRPETRKKRIDEIVELTGKNIKANQDFRPV